MIGSARVRAVQRALRGAAAVSGLLGIAAGTAAAQATDSTRARRDPARSAPVQGDSASRAARRPVVTPEMAASRARFASPITPRRAFVYSAVLPGLGQSKLDRGSSGALFTAVELAAMVMVRRTTSDLREARRYQADTLPTNFRVGVDGSVTAVQRVAGRYDADLVRTRRLHVEDWIAVVAFNHLFAGADAFVAAQLWDIPLRITAAPSANGPLFVASLRF